jgi:hypothetical protein
MVTQKLYTPVISKIILLCAFPADYIMVRHIDQQGWKELEDVFPLVLMNFFTVHSDGFLEAKPMHIHLRMFKAFLLFSCGKDEIYLPR